MRRSSLVIFNILLISMFAILGGRLWQMQVIEGGVYKDQAHAQTLRTITTKAIRGVIYDRNSLQLVSNRPVYAVAITPADLPTSASEQPRVAAMFQELTALLHTNPVVVVVADDLPPERQADVLNRLAATLGVSAGDLQPTVDAARTGAQRGPGYRPLR